jgi:hypothetical protein
MFIMLFHNSNIILNYTYSTMNTIKKKIHEVSNIYIKLRPHLEQDVDLEKTHKLLIDVNLGKATQTPTDAIDVVFELWNLLKYCISLISSEIKRLNQLYEENETQLSNKSFSSLKKEFYPVKIAFTKFQDDLLTDSMNIMNDITELVFANIDKGADLYKIFTYLTTVVKKNLYSVDLYAFITQRILNNADKSIIQTILTDVEDVKDTILAPKQKLGNSMLYKTNPHLKTFGLMPKTPVMSFDDLNKRIQQPDPEPNRRDNQHNNRNSQSHNNHNNSGDGWDSFGGVGESKKSGIDAIISTCSKNKWGLIVLNRVIKNPIKFNIWSLIDWNYAKALAQKSEIGVNEKIIERFNIMSYLDTKKAKWDFSVESVLSEKTIIIICVLSLSDAYILTPYANSSIKTKASDIYALIEYAKNKGSVEDVTRVSEYHLLHQRIILNNMFLPIRFNVSEITTQSKIIDSKFLRYTLLTSLMLVLNDVIKKEYSDGSKIQSTYDLSKIIHHDSLLETYSSIIVEQYDTYTFKNKVELGTFAPSETLMSFLSTLSIMRRDFLKGVHDSYVATKIDKKILTSDASSKRIYINKIFKDIIEDLLQKKISDDSNVYQSLIYKNKLLRLSLT